MLAILGLGPMELAIVAAILGGIAWIVYRVASSK